MDWRRSAEIEDGRWEKRRLSDEIEREGEGTEIAGGDRSWIAFAAAGNIAGAGDLGVEIGRAHV